MTMKTKYLLLIPFFVVLAGVIYAASGPMTVDQLEQKINSLEAVSKSDYTALDNKLAIVKSELKTLKADVDALKEERMSPTPITWAIYGVFLCLIAMLFILNISTIIRMRALRPMTAKQVAKIKDQHYDKLKEYVNYCRFQKGMSAVKCREELLSRGWTEDQLKGVLK